MIVKVKDSHVVLWAKTEVFKPERNVWYNSSIHTIESVDTIPYDFRGRHYTYDGSWARTLLGEKAKSDREQAELDRQEAEQIDADNNENIKADTLIDNLKSKSMSDIETYIDNNVVADPSVIKVLKVLLKLNVYQLNKQGI